MVVIRFTQREQLRGKERKVLISFLSHFVLIFARPNFRELKKIAKLKTCQLKQIAHAKFNSLVTNLHNQTMNKCY